MAEAVEAPAAAAEYWVHDLDPILIAFTETIAIRWYGLAYLFGLLAGWWLMRRWARKGLVPLADKAISDLVMYIGVGMIVGGRLGYCLFYQPSLFVTLGDSFPWWGVLAINEGGMASHGGIIGFFVGGCWFAHKQRISYRVLGDCVATGITIGIMAGRAANFINGELWGRVTDVPWAVIFPMAPDMLPRHPSQLYAFLLEGVMPLVLSLMVLGQHRRPGLNIGIVLATYAIGRFCGEFFREADSHMGYFTLGLSMGQLLTIPVFLAGSWWIVTALKRPPQPELYGEAVPPATKVHPLPHALRVLGIAEGCSTLVLFLIAMPLKYGAGLDWAVTLAGSIHGGLFVAYCALLLVVWIRTPWWHVGHSIALFIAAVVPFGPFVMDRRIARWADQASPVGSADSADSAEASTGKP